MQFDIDLQSPQADLFLKTRRVLIVTLNLTEIRKPRITTYSWSEGASGTGGICHMRTMPDGVDIGFLKGVALKDPLSQLNGTGKKMRVLHLTEFDQQTVTGFVRQAIALLSG